MSESAITTQIEELKSEALEALASVSDFTELDEWRVRYLGRRRGLLTQALRGLGSLPKEQRQLQGQWRMRLEVR